MSINLIFRSRHFCPLSFSFSSFHFVSLSICIFIFRRLSIGGGKRKLVSHCQISLTSQQNHLWKKPEVRESWAGKCLVIALCSPSRFYYINELRHCKVRRQVGFRKEIL